MKIGDVEIGVEYGAHDNPRESRYSRHALPRKVKALEIVTVEEQRWTGGGFSSHRQKVNIRRVKVKVLDEPLEARSYYRSKIKTADKGAELVVEARQLVGKWSTLSKHVTETLDNRRKAQELQESLEKRLKALGLMDERRAGYCRATVNEYRPDDPKLDINGASNVERLLSLAEKGLAAK